jgi:hypothetical protein
MADDKDKQDFEDAALYGTEAGRVRVPGDVLFRIGPQFDEETMKAAREMFNLNASAFSDAMRALAGELSIAESFAAGIQTAIEQLQRETGQTFDARAAIMSAWPFEFERPSLANIIGEFARAMQEQARVSAFAQLRAAQADVAARAAYNRTLGKDEGCQRKQEQQKAKV